jgi:AcrR family transcriptional regulator
VLDGALLAIAADGPTALSLRDVARRAGVSHAAPAHHFDDKAGVLTAIAAEGYTLLAETMRTALTDSDGELIAGGIAYVQFAVRHRAHFEVMFRPELYRSDDAAVAAARQAAAATLFAAVQEILGAADEEKVWGGVLAIWSFTHGLATLSLNSNFSSEHGTDAESAVRLAARSVVDLVSAGAFGP